MNRIIDTEILKVGELKNASGAETDPIIVRDNMRYETDYNWFLDPNDYDVVPLYVIKGLLGDNKKIIPKTNADLVDDFYIDLSADILTDYPIIRAYIDGVENNQIWYDNNNKTLNGFDETSDNIIIVAIL